MSSTDADDQAGMGRSDTISGLAKGLAILEMFGLGSSRLTIADAAQAVGITRAAARRCLLTLAELGYLAHDGKFFTPTSRLRRLGGRPQAGASLVTLAEPYLDNLRDRLKESISVAVLDGTDALFIARAEAERIVSTGVKVGRRLPAYCAATGRVLLGALDTDEARALLAAAGRPKRTPHTLIDIDEIMVAVDTARRDGYALSDEELEVGMRSMAVPIRDAEGECIAALSMSVSAVRISAETMREQFLPALQECAAALREGAVA
ncbi:helix-turn-helix domain-containing protein [Sphingobium naphthae]|nr:helix-turn-helix domain-containing protein [Sphingobium naphthae]